MQKVNPDLPNEKFLNTPENILLNRKKKQKEILEATKMINGLKQELDAHKANGSIMSKIEFKGITASRKFRPKWIYSDELQKQINLLEAQKRDEQNDNVAKLDQEKIEYYWVVR